MPETRSPEEMPASWTVQSFSHEKGFGTLVHDSGEEVIFNIDCWNLGSWKPSRRESAVTGAAAPVLPRPGEAVRVQWKRSMSGKNVPMLVEPTSRVSSARKEYKLGAWLKGIQKHTGRFSGLTAKDLVKALAKLDEDRAEEWNDGEPRDASDFAFLLMDIANVAEVDAAWAAAHAGWIYTDDHRWHRARARATLPAMVGLAPTAVVADTGDDAPLSSYVARCNAAADAQGGDLRLYELDLEGDAHVFVALTPEAFVALTKGGYLDVVLDD